MRSYGDGLRWGCAKTETWVRRGLVTAKTGERQREAETLSLSDSIRRSGEHRCPAWMARRDCCAELWITTMNRLRPSAALLTLFICAIGASLAQGSSMAAESPLVVV